MTHHFQYLWSVLWGPHHLRGPRLLDASSLTISGVAQAFMSSNIQLLQRTLVGLRLFPLLTFHQLTSRCSCWISTTTVLAFSQTISGLFWFYSANRRYPLQISANLQWLAYRLPCQLLLGTNFWGLPSLQRELLYIFPLQSDLHTHKQNAGELWRGDSVYAFFLECHRLQAIEWPRPSPFLFHCSR